MKIILFSFLLLMFTSLDTQAQSCKDSCPYYANFIKMAQADTVKNTQTKLNYYRAAIVAARDCHCPDLEESAYSQIDTLFILIDAEKRRAEAQSQTILEQQDQIKIALIDAEAANEKNMKIVNAMDFYDDKFALALKKGKYGFIDKEGNSKLSFEYDKGGPFDSETGFAEMGIGDSKWIKYLVDTLGNKYQLFNINEEYIILLNKKLIEKKAKKSKKIQSILKDYEFGLPFLNIELAYNLNKNKEKIALNFQGIKKSDVLEILDYLAKDSTIKDRIGVLMLSGDSLDIFPEAITEFENIVNIDIYWTNVKTIPKTIDRLTKLKKIKLPISVTEVPSSIYNLESLETLNLADTELETLPETIENLKNLKELRLPGYLVSLPENIGNLKNLEFLYLPTSVETLPEGIGALINLKELNIVNRRNFKKVPDVSKLKKLEDFYLTLHKDENYVVNLERLKVLQEKLPGCLFHIKNEKGEDVNVRRE